MYECGFSVAHSIVSELGTRAHWSLIVVSVPFVGRVCVRDVKMTAIHLLVVVCIVKHDRSVPFHFNISSKYPNCFPVVFLFQAMIVPLCLLALVVNPHEIIHPNANVHSIEINECIST